MNRLRSLLKKRRAQADPRVRRRLFSWRMFVIILLVVSVLSAGNAFALEKLLKMQVFSVVASMGVGSYWVAMAFLAALILHLYTCRRFDRPMRALSRAMRQVTEGFFPSASSRFTAKTSSITWISCLRILTAWRRNLAAPRR